MIVILIYGDKSHIRWPINKIWRNLNNHIFSFIKNIWFLISFSVFLWRGCIGNRKRKNNHLKNSPILLCFSKEFYFIFNFDFWGPGLVKEDHASENSLRALETIALPTELLFSTLLRSIFFLVREVCFFICTSTFLLILTSAFILDELLSWLCFWGVFASKEPKWYFNY